MYIQAQECVVYITVKVMLAQMQTCNKSEVALQCFQHAVQAMCVADIFMFA